MDITSGAWLSEMEMEEPLDFMNQQQQTCRYYSDSVDSFSPQSFKGYSNLLTRKRSIQEATINGDHKQQLFKAKKTSTFSPSCGSSCNIFTLSFGDQNQLKDQEEINELKEGMSIDELLGLIELPKRVPSTRRNQRQAQDHVLAERKRREKLSQCFVSLSVLLPDIEKTDKATVLEGASNYIKQLQTRVKELEETLVKEKDIIQDSTVSMKRSKFCGGHKDDASTSDENNSLLSCSTDDTEIKVRVSESNILVRIYCKRNYSLVVKALIEMERHHLTVICNNALPFSDSDLLITIIVQKNDEFVMTAMDLVKCLKSALQR